MFSSLFCWVIFVSASLQLAKWSGKQLVKVSIRWKPEESSWFKLSKVEKNTIQTIVGVYYETFDLHMLFGGEITSSYVMKSGLLEMMFIQERNYCILLGKRHHLKIISATNFVEIEVNRDKTSNSLNFLWR